jgi:hypothetical protein
MRSSTWRIGSCPWEFGCSASALAQEVKGQLFDLGHWAIPTLERLRILRCVLPHRL